VGAAKAAFPSWSKLSQDERANYLNKFADAIEANQAEFIELLGKEAGKPPQAGGFELFLVLNLARETPKLRLKETKPIDDADVCDFPSLLFSSSFAMFLYIKKSRINGLRSELPLCVTSLSALVLASYHGTSPLP
jgi:hypothetical protein